MTNHLYQSPERIPTTLDSLVNREPQCLATKWFDRKKHIDKPEIDTPTVLTAKGGAGRMGLVIAEQNPEAITNSMS